MSLPAPRVVWLDLIRAVAAQMIVLHHLAFYGPIAERIGRDWPGVIDWLADYARIAVQVFLVMSGYLVARSLPAAPSSQVWVLLRGLMRRYLRLFVPFVLAMAMAVAASWPARVWIGSADWVTQPPDLKSVLAHLTGLYDYLGVEALSAGAWYVSIDFQLHVLVMTSLWLCACWRPDGARLWRTWWVGVFALAAMAQLVFNRNPGWDITPFYFFGSFALGLAVERLSRSNACPSADETSLQRFERRVAGAILVVAAMAWLIEPAIRPAVAFIAASLILWLAGGAGARFDRALVRYRFGRLAAWLVERLGRSAYSLFLIHFPFAILVNALYQRYFAGDLQAALIAAAIAWLAAIPLSWFMYRWVEQPIEGLSRRPRGPARLTQQDRP
jgi:peptidoglycan/LPS O-acetylase OafA/YrhL